MNASSKHAESPSGNGKTLESTLATAIFEAAVDSILVIDSHGIVQAVNQSALEQFGFNANELVGNNVSCLMPAPHAQAHDTYIDSYCRTGERRIIGKGRETMGRRKDGSLFPLHLSVGEFEQDGRRLFVGICHDISARRRLTEHITFLATYDTLTGCVCRAPLIQSLDQALQSGAPHKRQLAVLFIDLDGFKQINDNHSHRVGDRMLKGVAERLRNGLRETDVLGRMGGDEFVAVLTLDGEPGLAEQICTRLLESLEVPFEIDELVLSVRASIGIALFPEHAQTADELINAADLAMYQAKLAGGNRAWLFDRTQREMAERTYRMLKDLREAISLGRFELHYQLQFDMRTLRPSGLEALLRWPDSERRLIQPGQFIPLALKYGLMPDIGRWVLRRACTDNASLIERGLLDVAVAVNICAPFFGQAGFVGEVLRILDDTGLPANRLELEITEDTAMSTSASVLQNAHDLKKAGIGLAMDDFGIGFSSLARLKQLQFDKLKIDRSFVDGLPDDDNDRAIVSAVLGLARSLHMRTVAEGIENRTQLTCLREGGCDQGQGFWFARPVPLEELADRLHGDLQPRVRSRGTSLPTGASAES